MESKHNFNKAIILFILGLVFLPTSSLLAENPATAKQSSYLEPSYVPGEVIVKLKDDISPEELLRLSSFSPLVQQYGITKAEPVFEYLHSRMAETGMSEEQVFEESDRQYYERTGRRPLKSRPPDRHFARFYTLTYTSEIDPLDVARQIKDNPIIENAGPNLIGRFSADPDCPNHPNCPNDPYISSQGSWGQNYSDQWPLGKLKMLEAWGIQPAGGSPNVIVAVLDTGVDAQPDIEARMWTGNIHNGYNALSPGTYPVDTVGHGTAVAGLVGATANNATGIAGVSWYPRIMRIKVGDSSGVSITAAANGFDFARLNGADILNCSFLLIVDQASPAGILAFEQAVEEAIDANRIVVAAAGNFYNMNINDFTPQRVRDVIVVAGSTENDELWRDSSYGDEEETPTRRTVDIMAPAGGNSVSWPEPFPYWSQNILTLNSVLSTWELALIVDNQWDFVRLSGTSLAAPLVSGIAALMLSADNTLTPLEVRDILRNTADDIGAPRAYGTGRVNAYRALQYVTIPPAPDLKIDSLMVTQIGDQHTVTSQFSNVGVESIPATTSVKVKVYKRPAGGQETLLWQGDYNGPIEVNETRSIALSPRSFSSGDTVIVRVDPDDTIQELDEINNWMSRGVTFIPIALAWNYPTENFQVRSSPTIGHLDVSMSDLEIAVGAGGVRPGYPPNEAFTIRTFKSNGNMLWRYDPIGASNADISTSPAIGDVTGDGHNDVVTISSSGRLKARNGFNGAEHWSSNTGASGSAVSPVLVDFENNGEPNILHAAGSRLHYRRGEDGILIWQSVDVGGIISSTPAIADLIGNDGNLEIVVTTNNGRIVCLNDSGNIVWTQTIQSGISIVSSPAIGDLDRDQDYEIVVGAGWKVYCLSHNGQRIWELPVVGYPTSSPALGDLDGDDYLDVVISSGEHLLALNHRGQQIFRIKIIDGLGVPPGLTFSSPVIGDLNGDGFQEIVVGSTDGYLDCYDRRGSRLWRFGLGEPIYSTPAIGDLDGDNFYEIIVGADDGNLYVYRMSQPGGELDWPMFHHDPQHSGRYGPIRLIPFIVPTGYTTIQAAIDAAPIGQRIVVEPGTYNEYLSIQKPVSLVSAGGAAVTTIQGFNPNSALPIIYFRLGSGNSAIDGFTITSPSVIGQGVIQVESASPSILNNIISGGGRGIYSHSNAYPYIWRNSISDYQENGIKLGNSRATIVENTIRGNGSVLQIGILANTGAGDIYWNLIEGNGTGGIRLSSYAGNDTDILHNTIVGNGFGIDFFGYSDDQNTIRNNIIVGNNGYGISLLNGSSPIGHTYNNLWNNRAGDYSGTTEGTGEIHVDPQFVGDENYHLKLHSLAVDAGDPGDSYQAEPGPNGGRVNLGHYGNTLEATISPQLPMLFLDDFNDGNADGWTVNPGCWAVEEHELSTVSGQSGCSYQELLASHQDPAFPRDSRISFNVRLISGLRDYGISVRSRDASNFILIRRNGSTWEIKEYINGTGTMLYSNNAGFPLDSHWIVELKGQSLKFYSGTNLVFSGSLSGTTNTSGNISLYVGEDAEVHFDNVLIEEWPVFFDDFNDGNSNGWVMDYPQFWAVHDQTLSTQNQIDPQAQNNLAKLIDPTLPSDARISLDATWIGGSSKDYGITVRHRDNSNSILIRNVGGQWELREYVNNEQKLYLQSPQHLNETYWVAELRNRSLKFYAGGYLIFDATLFRADLSGNLSLYTGNPNNHVHFDNVVIERIPTGGGGTCLLSGTPVLMADKTKKAIENIKVGDIILAYDVDTEKFIDDKVTEVFVHDTDNYLIINNKLKITPNHPVFKDGKWVEAGTLKKGDKILNQKGQFQKVKSIKLVKAPVKVYNLEVNPKHTYIANGYVVHNLKNVVGQIE